MDTVSISTLASSSYASIHRRRVVIPGRGRVVIIVELSTDS